VSFHFEKCANYSCRRPYLVEQFSNAIGNGRNCGELVCPHCGGVRVGDPNLVYVTAPMLPDEEAQLARGERALLEPQPVAISQPELLAQWKPT
jgi:hypothetical protein